MPCVAYVKGKGYPMGVAVVVLSGKGGTAKTLCQLTIAGEASRAGLRTLLVDVDPERNLSHRFRAPTRAGGLGAALEDAGVHEDGDHYDLAAGAARLVDEIEPTPWDGVDLLPAGSRLTGVGQVTISDHWLLRDLFDAGGITGPRARYDLVLLDTAGRSGSLVQVAMHAAEVAYAPVAPTMDAVRKALEARAKVIKLTRVHPELRWAGVLLSGFDVRVQMDQAIRRQTLAAFGEQVRAEVPRRAVVHEAFQLAARLGDRPDIASAGLARVFSDFLQHLLAVAAAPAGQPAPAVTP